VVLGLLHFDFDLVLQLAQTREHHTLLGAQLVLHIEAGGACVPIMMDPLALQSLILPQVILRLAA
jgi:hypothetical protein